MPLDQNVYLRVKFAAGDATDQVWSVDVEDKDRGCDKATIVMGDTGSVNADKVKEGMVVEIDIGWETESALMFEGVVRSVHPVARGTHRVEVIAFDPSIRLQQPHKEEHPERQHVGTLEAILKKLVDYHHIPFGSVRIDPMPNFSEPGIAQGVRSDWVFIQDLARHYRARAFVEVNAEPSDPPDVRKRGGRARFYFWSEEALLAQDPLGSMMYCRGMGSILEFGYKRISSGASPSLSATVVDPETGDPQTVRGPEPADPPPPEVSDSRVERVEAVQGTGPADDYKAGVQNASDAEIDPADVQSRREIAGLPSSPTLAEQHVQPDRTRILGFSGTGTAMGTVFLRAKGSVEIEGLASWAKGRWYAHQVNHIVQRHRVRKFEDGEFRETTQLTYRTKFQVTR